MTLPPYAKNVKFINIRQLHGYLQHSTTVTFSKSLLSQHAVRRKGREFLDEEAELSEEDDGADVSSDEEDGEEQNHSLEGFVVDNTHLSQGLNGTTPCLFQKNVILLYLSNV